MLEFINEISNMKQIKRRDFIEKDILLHRLLSDLHSDKFFSSNFIFVGGTCLMKCYLGYHRFSEDLDYTWNGQNIVLGKTKDENMELEQIINKVGIILKRIAIARDLDFKWDKDNEKYVRRSNHGRIATFNIYYDSVILKIKSLLKIQMNFAETHCHKPIMKNLQSLIKDDYSDLKVLFNECYGYESVVAVNVYNIKEILSEKIRAILTRRESKARDFVDVFLISKKMNIKPNDVKECAIKKLKFSIGNYERSKENFNEKKILIKKNKGFDWGKEKEVMINDINKKEFDSFISQFNTYLQEIIKKIESSI